VNQSLPQTLQIAVLLLYLNAGFTLLFGIDPTTRYAIGGSKLVYLAVRLLLTAGGVLAGYGIANERKLAWRLGIVVAAIPLIARVYVAFKAQVNPISYDLISLLFQIALVALLVHPQSRDYERIWFK
jgi:hypothetical protein